MLNNSLDVICALEEKQLSLNHVSTWDFFTLYTSLPHAQLKKLIFCREFLIPKEKASSLPIIFAPSGRTIRRQRGTRTSPVESLVSLLTFLSITSTFVLEARSVYFELKCINYRNPYPYWVTIFPRDWECLQQTDLNSAPLYRTSESTALFNYFLRLK